MPLPCSSWFGLAWCRSPWAPSQSTCCSTFRSRLIFPRGISPIRFSHCSVLPPWQRGAFISLWAERRSGGRNWNDFEAAASTRLSTSGQSAAADSRNLQSFVGLLRPAQCLLHVGAYVFPSHNFFKLGLMHQLGRLLARAA